MANPETVTANTSRGQLKRDDSDAPVGWNYVNITAAAPTTTVVKSGAGVLHIVNVNTAADTGVITLYDNTSATGTKIGTITTTIEASGSPKPMVYDVAFNTGLTIVTSTAAQDITVSYI